MITNPSFDINGKAPVRFLEDEYQTLTASVTSNSKSFSLLKLNDWVASKDPIPVYPPDPVHQTHPPALLLPEYEPVTCELKLLIGHGAEPENALYTQLTPVVFWVYLNIDLIHYSRILK